MIKKLFRILIALLIGISTFSGTGKITVHAEEEEEIPYSEDPIDIIAELGPSYEVFPETNPDRLMLRGVNTSIGTRMGMIYIDNQFGYDYLSYLYVGGEIVFCIEPMALFEDGIEYDENYAKWDDLSESQRQAIWEINYYGYSYPGHQTDKYYMATQLMIWEVLDQWYTPYQLDGSTPIDVSSEVNEIKRLRSEPQGRPSFNNQTVKTGLNMPVTLTDTKGTLSNYNVRSGSGVNLSVSGNNLTVTLTSEDYDKTLTFSNKYDARDCHIIYGRPGWQNTIYMATRIDPTGSFKLNFELAYAKIKVQKKDAETESRAQGDATLNKAVFELKDKSGTTVETLKSSGAEVTSKEYPVGTTLYLSETTAPEGYRLNNEKITIGMDEVKDTYTVSFTDQVITGNFTIHKVMSSRTESEFSKPEKNAEFTVVLKKYVDQYGSVAEAIKHKDDFADREWDILVTDENGDAKSKNLAYGHYVIAQTGGEAEYEIVNETADFIVDTEDQPTKQYNASNIPETYYIKMMKLDKDTGEKVIYHSATFKLQDSSGNDVDMRVGSKHYTSFKTSSMDVGEIKAGTFYNDDEEQGTAFTPLVLEAGTYSLTEIETPWGFVELDKPISITVEESRITEVDGDNKNVIVVEISNDRAYGELIINKTVENFESDTTFIDRTDLSTVEFTLFAKEDILNPDDGSVLYNAGDVYGVYNLSKDGSLDVKNIPLGKYELKETAVPDGMILDETVHEISFEQTDSTTKVYKQEISVENKTTKVEISKKTATGDDELLGASIEVKDSQGNTVDEWISGDKPHIIEGLKLGETYTLTETITPKDENGEDLGYAKASSIEFTVNEDGSVKTVTVIDKFVSLTKEDGGNGEEVPGAKIQIIDKDGEIVDEWVSGDEPHKIKNLEVGKIYTMHEEQAPDGYYYAVDGKFTVTDDGMDQVEQMIDNPIIYQILKVDDQTGEPVEGVELQLIDLTTGEEVSGSPWITTKEPIVLDRVLIAGHSYELTESEWVAGVHKSISMTFTVGMTGTAETKTITMVDLVNAISFLKVDSEGKPLAGAVLQIFETTEDEDGNIIPAVDENGNEIVVTSFTTTDDLHGVSIDDDGVEIASLLKGDVLKAEADDDQEAVKDPVYILREAYAPFGYELAEDITFTVTGTLEKPQMIQMTDERNTFFVSVDKVDADDHEKKLSGAEITIFNAKTNEVAKTVQGKDAVTITDKNGNAVFEMMYLEDGYYVKETKAPEDYKLNKNSFKVELSEDYDFAKDNPVVITVDDKKKPVETGVVGPLWAVTLLSLSATAIYLLKKKKPEIQE